MTKLRCQTCDADASENAITMHSIVNHEGKGFVHLAWGTNLRIQFNPAETRLHALSLLRAAEAAETDSAVLKLMMEKIGLPQSHALVIISDLRNYRDDQFEVKPK